jgi:hypothetical protein
MENRDINGKRLLTLIAFEVARLARLKLGAVAQHELDTVRAADLGISSARTWSCAGGYSGQRVCTKPRHTLGLIELQSRLFHCRNPPLTTIQGQTKTSSLYFPRHGTLLYYSLGDGRPFSRNLFYHYTQIVRGIVDWEFAVYYPIWYEYVSASWA